MKTSVLIFLTLLSIRSGYAQNPAEIFLQANKLYQEGKFGEAVVMYETLVRSGYESAEFYFNLGNARYKTGGIARAILNYERARRLIPDDDDLRHNLQIANLMITDKIEAAPHLFVWDYWESVKGSFSINSITWIAYGAYVALLGSLCFVILARSFRVRKLGLITTFGSSVLLAAFFVILVGKATDLNSRTSAIVTAEITTVKNSPDAKSSDAFVLHGGVKVQITDSVSDWMKIRLVDGKVGWMEKSAAEII